ncbi:glycosyltransferase family 2 protein [Paenibacillus alkalitolerans]|uniref:glycosyltransferase family 2 protein n=1 Tax=Paenibacillus alkalitolerans TaxID=2799335 RepID=UPI001F2F19FF|nr:glycosyltransferase family 2 protein [Paenibacillus alkalitolerans]
MQNNAYCDIPPVLAVVVPCYNEEDALPESIRQLIRKLDEMSGDGLISSHSFLLFVDDGSQDSTWPIIEQYRAMDGRICGMKLARNAGHQNALLAGLTSAAEWADCVISIDADLQDDIELMSEMVRRFLEGNDIVYGVRSEREKDSWFKRTTAVTFYRLMARFGVRIVFNHADYRLMSRRALLQLAEFREVNLFLRGLVPLLGFRSAQVVYKRKERQAGQSKYPFRKMLSFAWNGITSFSVIPIRLVTLAGCTLFVISVAAGIYALYAKWTGRAVTGWTSLMVSLWFIGGVQLICLGLVGEYIGKIYKEVKHRPLYIVEQVLKDDNSAKIARDWRMPLSSRAAAGSFDERMEKNETGDSNDSGALYQ